MYVQQRPSLPPLRVALRLPKLPHASVTCPWQTHDSKPTLPEQQEAVLLAPLRPGSDHLQQKSTTRWLPSPSPYGEDSSAASSTGSARGSRAGTPMSFVDSNHLLSSPLSGQDIDVQRSLRLQLSFVSITKGPSPGPQQSGSSWSPTQIGWLDQSCFYYQAVTKSTPSASWSVERLVEAFFAPPTGPIYENQFDKRKPRPEALQARLPTRSAFSSTYAYQKALKDYSSSGHTVKEGGRRVRHGGCQHKTHKITPDVPNQLARRDPDYPRAATDSNKPRGGSRAATKDDQFFSTLYMYYFSARVILELVEVWKIAQAEVRVVQAENKKLKLDRESSADDAKLEARIQWLEARNEDLMRRNRELTMRDHRRETLMRELHHSFKRADPAEHHTTEQYDAAGGSPIKKRKHEACPAEHVKCGHSSQSSLASTLPPSPSPSLSVSFTSRCTDDVS